MYLFCEKFTEKFLGPKVGGGPFGRRRLGAADWVPYRLSAGNLGAISQFLFIFRVMKKKQ